MAAADKTGDWLVASAHGSPRAEVHTFEFRVEQPMEIGQENLDVGLEGLFGENPPAMGLVIAEGGS